MVELQAKWVAQVLSGKMTLPSREKDAGGCRRTLLAYEGNRQSVAPCPQISLGVYGIAY